MHSPECFFTEFSTTNMCPFQFATWMSMWSLDEILRKWEWISNFSPTSQNERIQETSIYECKLSSSVSLNRVSSGTCWFGHLFHYSQTPEPVVIHHQTLQNGISIFYYSAGKNFLKSFKYIMHLMMLYTCWLHYFNWKNHCAEIYNTQMNLIRHPID